MKKICILLLLVLLLSLCAPCALAADALPYIAAERTASGVKITPDGSLSHQGKLFFAAYDLDGRMLAADLVDSGDAADLQLSCDAALVRRVRLFGVDNRLNPETIVSRPYAGVFPFQIAD